jgi:transcriptional regulator with XRE-family HTH domain
MLRLRSRVAVGRLALGLEPGLLDAVCGLREGTIARLETGRSRIAPAHLCRLAAVFGVGIDWFFDDAICSPPSLQRENHDDHPAAPSCEEMRRFLAAFARLHDGKVREEIRLLVSALANRACGGGGGGLPEAWGDSPPAP